MTAPQKRMLGARPAHPPIPRGCEDAAAGRPDSAS